MMIKLNLGAGDTQIDGYTAIDRKDGNDVYPLSDVDDGAVDVIRASHVLEHFGHREISKVLAHWVQKLKPGGCLKVAVPDFKWVAEQYSAGVPINTQGYVMGGHVDDNDHHGAIFDKESLTEHMASAGLERISRWESEIDDCASLPVSLNLKGYKPSVKEVEFGKVSALLSAPRFGPVLHTRCAFEAFAPVRIPYRICQGAYWHQVLSDQLEDLIKNKDLEYVITCDYDTVFRTSDVVELYRLMKAYSEADAICPIQQKRDSDFALFGIIDDTGKHVDKISTAMFLRNLTRITTGHFGLTIFRAESLRRMERPWMCPIPNGNGLWADGKTDADIDFWKRFQKQGYKLYLANKVVIGHVQEMITWPGKDLRPIHQFPSEYQDTGIPKQVDRLWQ